jgi:3',5'-cyclic AMP phosphodiesterase CpdA
MRVLDGLVPYVLVPGNHDTDANRVGLIDNYFAPTTMPWISGTMNAGQIENNYALVDIGPQKWLVLGLEFGPRDAVLTWADGVLKAHPTLPAIIVTHAYLYGDGTRYNIAVSGLDSTQPNFQWFIPQWYGYTSAQGINDGEEIWQKLIVPNANVHLVFCGHDNGAARLTSFRADGSRVHQMLSDYQWLHSGTADDRGGSGFLRVLEFDYNQREIRVQTYSPHLDEFMTDDANQFTLSLEL